MNNERGGIISKLFIIPIGVALMAGFFFLGYYVGKYQSKTNSSEIVVPLPEVISQNLPKKEEFTFFKTLSDRQNKTVSIDLKPKSKEEAPPQKKETADLKKERVPQKEKKPEQKVERLERQEKAEKPEKSERTAVIVKPPEQKVQPAKKEPVITRSPASKVRYTLQVASYQERDVAEADVRRLKQHGFSAFVIASELEGKGTWYRVRVGSFTDKAAAERLQKEIRSKEAITPFITME